MNNNQTPYTPHQPPLPHSPPSLALSITGIAASAFMSLCCVYLPIGLIISIISMAMAQSQINKGNPHPKLKVARVLCIIGIIFGAAIFLFGLLILIISLPFIRYPFWYEWVA